MALLHRSLAWFSVLCLCGTLTSCAPRTPGPDASESKSGGDAAVEGLQIPEFPTFASDLKNRVYTISVRETDQDWQEITPYTVKINPNPAQNIKPTDPMQESPMVYFGMRDREVEVKITREGEAITSAKVYPLSYDIPCEVRDNAVLFRLSKPANVCVELNGERYDMVYVFANPAEAAPESGENVRVIGPGVTTAPKAGTMVWKGGLQDLTVYEGTAMPADEIRALSQGQSVQGYTRRWRFTDNLTEESGAALTTYNNPRIQQGIGGKSEGCLYMNGLDDALSSETALSLNDDLTVSVWAYLDPSGTGAQRTILDELLYVRSDGTVGSNLGDWQFPYVTENTVSAGAWHHLALVKRGNELTVYIDGESGGTDERPPIAGSAGVRIGTGVLLDALYLHSGETLYLAPGAVLRGAVIAYGVENTSIRGMGIIDQSPFSGVTATNGIWCAFSQNVNIEGVIVNNIASCNIQIGQCRQVTVKNFKCFTGYGGDGVNTRASSNITIDGCFLRTNDDTVSLAATSFVYLGSTSHYTVRNSTLICDQAHNIMIGMHGQEYGDDTISNLLYENLDIVDSKCINADYQGVIALNAGNDVTVKDAVFRNIRVQDIKNNQLFNIRVLFNRGYNLTPGKSIENILIENVTYNGENVLPCVFSGYSAARMVQNVTFRQVTINGKPFSEEDYLDMGYIKDIHIED